MARTHLTHPFAATAISSLAVCTLLGVSSASAHEGCALHAHATGSAAATVKSSKKSPEERSKETLNGVSTAKDKSVAQKAATRSATTIRQASQQDALTVATGPSIEALHGHSTAFLAVPSGIPEEIDIEIPLDGRMETLRLFRASMRTADAKLYVDDGSGGLREEALPPHRTYRGSLASTGEAVSASIIDGALWAMIPMDDDIVWVQPMSDFGGGVAPHEHVIYRRSQLEPLREHGCGVDHANLADPDWMLGLPNDPGENGGSVGGDSGEPAGMPAGDGGVAGANPFRTKVAFDADFEFFQRNNSNLIATVNDIETVMNNVTLVYDRDVDISYEYSAFVVRTTSADPYTTNVMDDLLCEFRTTWNTLPESEILRDVAQLFTGKTIQGSVIGLAWLGVVCNQQGNDCGSFGNLAYSTVESRFTTVSDFRTSLSAHELGHNWQAQHCDSASPCNVMCAVINGCQGTTGVNLKFGPTEQAQIINFRNAVACDVALPAPIALPFVENFESSALNTQRWIYNKGATVTTAAQNEPSPTRSLALNSSSANTFGDDEVRSNFMLLGGQSTGTVRYFVQRNGVESGEQLVVEYLNNLQRWSALNTITSDGINQTTFTEFTHALPANALHNKFRLRFRTLGDETNDLWYIDDVSVVAVVIPPNDECLNALVVGTGATNFTSANATASDPALPVQCDGGFGTSMQSDVWFFFTATCTGEAKATTCGTTAFDSRIAVYNFACPTGGSLAGCNNTDPECTNGAASVVFQTVAGGSYYIRVGSNAAGGAGTLTITCAEIAPCPADLNEDGAVNAEDLSAVLGAWGTSGGDVSGDGITDASDLAAILGAWGDCP